jgi:hypothetical protein
MLQRSVGSIDGNEMIRMNNLAVGYFPSDSLEIGVYPPPQPEKQFNPEQGPEQEPGRVLIPVLSSGMSF